MKTLTPEQVLEKMLDNVRNDIDVFDGIIRKYDVINEWGKPTGALQINCLFSDDCEFRLTPRTRSICGFDVPAPEVDEPDRSDAYWTLDSMELTGVIDSHWTSSGNDRVALKNGLWLSEADAIANAKALRGENPYE